MGNVINKFVVAVPHQQAYVVETLGKYSKTLNPGLSFLLPLVQRVAYKHSLKEQAFQVTAQNTVTRDNVIVSIDGVLYLKIDDPIKCSYGALDPLNYAYILAQSTTRSEIGNLTLDQTFEERDLINQKILEQIKAATEVWGVTCLRYEIKDIIISETIKKVMNLEAESERKKRADILISQGRKVAEINLAEAAKKRKILNAEAKSQEIQLQASAIVQRINQLSFAIEKDCGQNAAEFNLAYRYIDTLKSMGGQNKNIIVNYNITNPEQVVQKSMNLIQDQQQQQQLLQNSKQTQN
ncbi:membrane protease stomatin prohibitin family protein, putative [Ichthyophthirius multifiliis]|uniref:Membrane protease stomatin prohibitin family protein, putative n=1 Tax=Ichthyophthirius multifiliis TaxID=5932 RepID=G0QTD0_ICHMU|nr:membrane protease stomatin prohibitin family protein, putative [Ichthyophthirius multifiliis]EGR31507.1 membrane protease stomatin prohibitin family protein, putative [Ichthyophthirius multifiliis]|eukprot:XP_004034993.1 membrane protease stomatin prohibitin family protein, putative [Ichthyophthirius multifiliis]